MGTNDTDGQLMGELLRVPYQAVVGHVQRALSAAGYDDLRPAHLSVFQHIDHPPEGTRLTALAERAQLTKQSMGQIVTDLEAWGYVERIPDPTDRRAKIIRMTERGWAAHKAAGEIVRFLEARWAERIGRRKLDDLRHLLRELIAALDA